MIYPGIERSHRSKSVARPTQATRENCPANVATGVFDKLFCMLKTRLRAIAVESGGATSSSDHSGVQAIKARIFEFAAALDHVHAALTLDIVRLHEAERDLHQVRAALRLAQADLFDIRAAGVRTRHIVMQMSGPSLSLAAEHKRAIVPKFLQDAGMVQIEGSTMRPASSQTAGLLDIHESAL